MAMVPAVLLVLLWPSVGLAMRFGMGDPFAPPAALYGPNDVGVVSLTNDDLRDPAKGGVGGPEAWLVEFYSSWCGHCVQFAPDYKKLAKDVKGELD